MSSRNGPPAQPEGVDYIGNFAVGDALVAQPFISDQMNVSFTPPIEAVGSRIACSFQSLG
jgi:hypothetical protein